MAHPGAARRRLIAKARATNARDRQLAGLTYGAQGGLAGGFGAFNAATNTPTGLTGGARRPTIVKGGPIEGGGQTGITIAGNNLASIPPRTFIPPPKTPPTPVISRPIVKNYAVETPKPKKPLIGTKLPGARPPPKPLPLPEPEGSVTNTGGSSAGASSSGGGGGGGGSSSGGGGTPTLVPDYQPTDLPDVDDVAATSSSSSMSTGTKVAIGAGIAAALYLLLKGDE